MYRDSYQRGMLTVFFSGGSKPLEIWETKTKDGYIKRFLDPEIKTMVLEIRGNNISTTYMSCPKGNQVLGITMPFLVMIVKNLMKYFSFEVTVLDSTGTRRRFRVSNFQSTTQILPLCTVMPIGLASGWNQIQFNLAEFTRRAYKNQFVEVQRLKINANIRIRRIYFTEKLMSDDELPVEYKLYFPLQQKGPKSAKGSEADKENIKTPTQDAQIVQDKKISATEPARQSFKAISEGAVKKSRKSMETVAVATQEQEIMSTPLEPEIDKSAAQNIPQEVEISEIKQPSGELQVTGEEKPADNEPGLEKSSSVGKGEQPQVTEEIKGGENVNANDQEGKGEDSKVEESENKGEGDKKPEETSDKEKEGDKPGEETDKGEGDKNPEATAEGDKNPEALDKPAD